MTCTFRRLNIAIVALVIAVHADKSSHAQQGQPLQFVPGAEVGLVPMEGFSPSDKVADFEDRAGGSILVDVLPKCPSTNMLSRANRL